MERLRRAIKYERIYLQAHDSVSAAKADVAQFMDWYNNERPHSSLSDETPQLTYMALLHTLKTAA